MLHTTLLQVRYNVNFTALSLWLNYFLCIRASCLKFCTQDSAFHRYLPRLPTTASLRGVWFFSSRQLPTAQRRQQHDEDATSDGSTSPNYSWQQKVSDSQTPMYVPEGLRRRNNRRPIGRDWQRDQSVQWQVGTFQYLNGLFHVFSRVLLIYLL